MNPLTTGLGIVALMLFLALSLTGWLYKDALEEKSRITGEYESFKVQTKLIGEKAEKERLAELARQKEVHDERLKSLEKRLASSLARADRLCKSAGLSAGCRALPPVPDTTRPTDDTGFNERLLEVLRHAQEVSDKLTELQAWVNSNALPRHQSGLHTPPSLRLLRRPDTSIEVEAPLPSPYTPVGAES
jgi:hypothetical protein